MTSYTEKVVIDTSYFVAYLNKKDRHHAEAVKLSKALENYHPYITDHILDELVTYFSYRVDRRHAASVAEAILKKIDEGELDMVHADREILTQALIYLKKYNRDLSFTDCITLATMDKLAAQHILTFDSDFDNVTLLKTRKRVVNIRWLH
ncbi:type II toxin-antitoxin system VapC family toxin [Pyrobaculum sp.]|uniref:type II toxin-antitoxin system VapC family toxin n=1 Tax=Pyrobaculum sp. TaxID=2004705 RepID=UPI003D0C1F05